MVARRERLRTARRMIDDTRGCYCPNGWPQKYHGVWLHLGPCPAADDPKQAEIDHLQARQRRSDYDLICGDCGGPHFLDCSLPSEVWNKIARPEETLCAVCIDRRLQGAGLTTDQAEFYFAGEALRSKLYANALEKEAAG